MNDVEVAYNDVGWEEATYLLGLRLTQNEDETLADKDKYDRRESFYKDVDSGYWPALVECYYKTLDKEGKVETFIQTNFRLLKEFALGSLSETRFMKPSEEDQRFQEFFKSLHIIAISYNKTDGDNNV